VPVAYENQATDARLDQIRMPVYVGKPKKPVRSHGFRMRPLGVGPKCHTVYLKMITYGRFWVFRGGGGLAGLNGEEVQTGRRPKVPHRGSKNESLWSFSGVPVGWPA
jgi:hypothetical protein